VKGIADTGFLVAFGNRKDQHHSWARKLAIQITEPLDL
jgi:predicted nucleic acid-binding protein